MFPPRGDGLALIVGRHAAGAEEGDDAEALRELPPEPQPFPRRDRLRADGDPTWSLTSERFRDVFATGAASDGLTVAPPSGLDPRCKPHPIAAFHQMIRLAGAYQADPRSLCELSRVEIREPPRFVGTAWWRTQSRETGLRRPNSAENARFCG